MISHKDLVPSSPTTGEAFIGSPQNLQNEPSLASKCAKYHLHLDTIHAKIYRYNSFDELLKYLKTTLQLNFPYINYPSKEILLMVLTGTQLNHVEEKTSNTLLNFAVPSIEYLNYLFDLLQNPASFDDVEMQAIHDEEISNLYCSLNSLFSFLKPSPVPKRYKRRRANVKDYTITQPILPVEDSTYDYSMEDNADDNDTKLREEKIQSLMGISTSSDKFNNADTFFGIKYLSETEKNFWKYVIFAFKTASKLTEINREDSYESYNETWCRWREFLNICIRFMEIELKRSTELRESLFFLNLLNTIGCSDSSDVSQEQYLDSLLTFVEYVFTDTQTPCNIASIIPTDLTLTEKYSFTCNPSMPESKYRGSGICLDSLPTRSRLLRTCWKYLLRLPIDSAVRNKFCNKVAKELLKLKPRELLDFFFDPASLSGNSNVSDDVLFRISFEIMRLLSRSWTMTSDNFLDDFKVYLNQLKTLFDSLVKPLDSSQKQDPEEDPDASLFMQESFTDEIEKCFILTRYQLQLVLHSIKLTEEEWSLLDDINFNIGNNCISLGKLAKSF